MTPQDFISAYEAALATQDWDQVAPLIHETALVVFSNGALHAGKDAIGSAYRRNFSTIKNETYQISDVQWLLQTDNGAAYAFVFHWRGLIDGQPAAGAGRGTAVLRREGDSWVLMGEHLGPKA